MPGQPYDITFSVGLIEKLAGIRKPPAKQPSSGAAQQQQQAGPRLGLPHALSPHQLGRLLPAASPELGQARHLDAQLGRALQAAREQSGLLLKHEEEELQRVRRAAQEAVAKCGVHAAPPSCTAERDAVTACLQDNKQGPSKCKPLVEAYSRCSFGTISAKAKA